MTLPEFIELLKTGGPYTALAVVMYVARFLFISREKDREKFEAERKALTDKSDADKQALNERIIRVVEGQNTVTAKLLETQQAQTASLARAVDNQRSLMDGMRAVRALPSASEEK